MLSNNTWNFGGVGSNTWQVTGSTSGAGLQSVASGDAINFNNYNTGAVTIGSPILAFGTNLVSVFGTGTLIFSAANTYTGGTTISGGTLQIASGGSISGGTVTVASNGGDNGTLNITGGSVSDSIAYLGLNTGSSGTATVSSGAWNTSGNFFVGYSGTGLLNLTGGAVSAGSGYVGYNAGSSGTATVSSGTWSNTGDLSVGNAGTGVLNLTGGNISDSIGYLGLSSSSNGTATVSGGTWSNSIHLFLGYSGTGVLNLTDSGVMMATVGATGAGTLTIANIAGSNGTLNLGTGGVAGTLHAGTVTGGSGTAVVNFNQTGNYTFAPKLTGSLSVNKLGAGTTLLTGSSNYTGPTTVSQGALLVSGSISGSTTTVSGDGSTLGGTGTVGGVSVDSGAILEGGDGSGPSGALTSGGTVSLGFFGSGNRTHPRHGRHTLEPRPHRRHVELRPRPGLQLQHGVWPRPDDLRQPHQRPDRFRGRPLEHRQLDDQQPRRDRHLFLRRRGQCGPHARRHPRARRRRLAPGRPAAAQPASPTERLGRIYELRRKRGQLRYDACVLGVRQCSGALGAGSRKRRSSTALQNAGTCALPLLFVNTTQS